MPWWVVGGEVNRGVIGMIGVWRGERERYM